MSSKLSSFIFRLLICIVMIIISMLIIQFLRGGLSRSEMTNRIKEDRYKSDNYYGDREPDKKSSISYENYYLDFQLPDNFYSEKIEAEGEDVYDEIYTHHDYLSNRERDIIINVDLAAIKDESNIRYTPDMVIAGHAYENEKIYKEVINNREIMYVARESRNEENVHYGNLFIVVPLFINDIESPYYYKIDITEYDYTGLPSLENYTNLLMFDYYTK